MNETGVQHSTQVSKQCFQLLPFNIFAFLYPASLFMDIVILNCVVYLLTNSTVAGGTINVSTAQNKKFLEFSACW